MKTLFFIFIFFILSSLLNSTIINVSVSDSIQSGINTATNGDTVLVQPGTYIENIDYNGKRITVGSLYLTTQDTSYIYSTIIDGNSSGSVVTFSNYENSLAVLCGFTIRNGSGVGCYHSSPTLDNLLITDNTSGGVHCLDFSHPSLLDVTISDNSAMNGGGIFCWHYSFPILQNVTISGNTATDKGGGIYCIDNSSPDLNDVTITGNSAIILGGGIYCEDNSNPNLENVTISGNSADSGGGIFCYNNSSPTLLDVTITENFTGITGTECGGGIVCGFNSNLSLQNVTITNNTTLFGGGI